MTIFGAQAVALLDHLEIEKAVVGGTSLGANATLEAAVAAQERVQGMLIEMPVLDNALLGCAIAFTPLLIGLTFGAPRRARGGPRGGRWCRAAGRCSAQMRARLRQPGSQAVGLGPAGALLRTHRAAAARSERGLRAARAGDRPSPGPDPSVLRLGHADARAAERAPARGVLDPRAADLARAPDRRRSAEFIDDCWGGPGEARPRRRRRARATRPGRDDRAAAVPAERPSPAHYSSPPMASRKEQKEQLRREREEREAAAKAAERRKRMIGYGAGGALVAAVVVVVLVVLLVGGGGDGGVESGGGAMCCRTAATSPSRRSPTSTRRPRPRAAS